MKNESIDFNDEAINVIGVQSPEEELLTSRVQLELLLESTQWGVVFIDSKGIITKVNQVFSAMFGLSSEKILARPIFPISQKFVKEDGSELNYEDDPFIICIQRGKPITNFLIIFYSNFYKGRRQLRINASPLFRKNESIPCMIYFTFEDITDSKDIGVSEQRFLDAFNYSGVGMAIVSLNGNFLEVNDSFCKMTDYSSAELLKMNLQFVMCADDWLQDVNYKADLLLGKIKKYSLERRCLKRGGHVLWCLLTMSLVRDKNDNPLYFIGQFQDITEIKKEQKHNEEYKEKFEAIVNNPSVGTAIARKNKVVYASPMILNFFEFSSLEEITVDSIIDRATPDSKLILEERVEKIRKGEAVSRNFVAHFYDKEKNVRSYEIETVEIQLSDGPHRMATLIDVTEKLSSEKALREAEAMFRLAQNFANIGSWKWQITKGEHFWSDMVYKIFGYEDQKDTFSIQVFSESVYPGDRKMVDEAFRQCLETGSPCKIEYRIIVKPGRVKWLQFKGNVIRDSNNAPVEMYGVIGDITENVRKDKELKSNKEKYKLLAEYGRDMICMYDHSGGFNYTSPAVKSLLGFDPAYIVTKKMKYSDLVHPDETSKIKDMFKSAIRHPEKVFSGFFRFRNVEDEYVWCEKTIQAIVDDNQKIGSLRSSLRDVHYQVAYEEKLNLTNEQLTKSLKELELKKSHTDLINKRLSVSRHKLKEINAHLKLTTNALNRMANVVLFDKEGNIIDANKKFLKITEYERKEIIGRTKYLQIDGFLYSGMHPSSFFSDLWSTLNRGKVWSGEICYSAKSGKLFWLLQTAMPLVNDEGQVTHIFSFGNDITLLKKRENEIIEAKGIAEEASQMKENFLSVMSHEIRTPLNSVIGLSNLLLRRSPRTDQLEIIRTLKGSSDNLLYLINNILDYSKIQAGKMELEHSQFNLREFLKLLYSSFKLSASDKGLGFTVSLDPRVPVTLLGDVVRMNQIFNNIVSNAIKFTASGYVRIKANLKSKEGNRCVVTFEIADTGIGISQEKLNVIFLPFRQSDRSISRKYGGSGLGLSIVKGLIELLNGKFSVTSDPGKRTTFAFELEFEISDDLGEPNQTDLSRIIPERKSLAGSRVLYVEDVESNQYLIKNLLVDHGVHCTVASSGAEALEFTNRNFYNVILMDIQMPDMNGYQVTKAVRRQVEGKNKRTPIIAFTAEPYTEQLRKKVLAKGIQDIITKPFEMETLLEKIALSSRRKSQDFISFSFYKNVMDFDKIKLKKIKRIMVSDFTVFRKVFFQKNRQRDFKGMRKEIHKIKPIAKNLQCSPLVALLEKFITHDKYSDSLTPLNSELRKLLVKLLKELKSMRVTE